MTEFACSLSVVIPAFNEALRLPDALKDTLDYLGAAPESWEIIIVDDGSKDGSWQTVQSWMRDNPLIRGIRLERNQGKGAAVRAGVLAARGRHIVFRDSDLSTPMREFDKFRPELARGTGVVIGSRRVPGANLVRRQPWLREALGKCFTAICRSLLVPRVRDYTCGFKAFSASAAREIFSRQAVSGWGFDAELIFLADRLGYDIAQVPVSWTDDRRSKVRLWLVPLRTLAEIAQIRVNALFGRYRLP
jgi:glycosyltransferase involved in cell wall biosynthesis